MKSLLSEGIVTARITKLILILKSSEVMIRTFLGNLTEDRSRNSSIIILRYFRKRAREDLLDHIQEATKAVLQSRVCRVS